MRPYDKAARSAGSHPCATADRSFKTVVPFTSGHETAISQLTHCCKIMIYSFAVGCWRDTPAMYRQTDTVGSPGALTQAAPRAGRINAVYLCVSFTLSLCSLNSLFLSAWLRGWTGGGGEKQLDGTNDVTNNTFPHTSSICGKQTIETLPVPPPTANAPFNKHFDKL